MRTIILCLSLVLLSSSAFSQDMKSLALGDEAPKADMKMIDVSGEAYSLTDLTDENGLLVIFSCNTCPFVIGNGTKSEGWEGRYNDLFTLAEENQIGMVLVNPNEAKRDQGDSFKDMVAHAKKQNYESHYVIDENHILADAFGAMRTPHVYLFDGNSQLVYHGAIDDNVNRASEVQATYLMDALGSLGLNEAITIKETPAMGCSIKRK